MRVTPVKTDKITPGSHIIFNVLDNSLSQLKHGSIVAITSKIVAICEGRTVPKEKSDLETLIKDESELYLTHQVSRIGHRTIVQGTLVSGAGIDESNAAGNFVLLPKDSQKSANELRAYLSNKFNLRHVGVLITDSTSTPLRLGASGIALGWSGFKAINDYRGKRDLFGRKIVHSRANIAGALASAATLVMGEGAEQTPIVIIEDVPFVQFQRRNPSKDELGYMNIALEDDLFAPMLTSVKWKRGKGGKP